MAATTSFSLPEALLGPIKDGTYPEAEEVITSELKSADLAQTFKLLSDTTEELKAEIRQASSGSSSEVNSWITQARQLQADIERSRQEAREIVQKYEASKALSGRVEDASAKVRLLHSETEYNDTILALLQAIKGAVEEVSSVALLVDNGDLKAASTRVQGLERALHDRISVGGNEQAWSLLLSQAAALRTRILEALQARFDHFVHLEVGMGQVLTIETEKADRGETHMTQDQGALTEILAALADLGELDHTLSRTSKRLNRALFQPLISRSSPASLARTESESLTLQRVSSKTTEQVIDDLGIALRYLQARLPQKAGASLISACVHLLIPALVSEWLSAAIPLDLQELDGFRNERLKVNDFSDWLSSNGWEDGHQLTQWLERVPRMWLTKRRTAALDGVRKAFLAYQGETKVVERVERETVNNQQHPLGEASGWDEWNAEWTQDQEGKATQAPPSKDDDDVTGWDFNDADEREAQPESNTNNEDDATDAWGWGDDEENPQKVETVSESTKSNGTTPRKAQAEREVVLKETYTVTDMPDRILTIISKELQDANDINKEEFAWLHSASPSTGLRALPVLVLAMFRATASSFYETAMSSGNMHLYNDCLYLAEQFRHAMDSASAPNHEDDVTALEKYAKSAYAREMEIQRTVLGDLLDGAQGFASCTEYPFSAECETAVASTIDRIRLVHEEWKMILSQSALLQSTGSLLATVIDKIIKDIEDMEDISEAESQRLGSFCGQISKLDSIFMPEGPISEESIPMTAVYVPNWLRFQYLANILDSSLVDIKYLWTEGELSLEFSVDEVVDLIRALFADSHHRKNAIAEIRRSQPLEQ